MSSKAQVPAQENTSAPANQSQAWSQKESRPFGQEMSTTQAAAAASSPIAPPPASPGAPPPDLQAKRETMARAGFNLAEVPLRPMESEAEPHQGDRPTIQAKFEGVQRKVDGESDPLKTFSVIQTKLTVGEPGDKYEQEADRTAAQVMRMPDPQADEISTESLNQPQIQRMCSKYEEEQEEEQPSIQMKEGGDRSPSPASNLESRLASQSGKGSALPESVRSFMEPRFGNDFSGVRVHTDSASVQMNKELGAQAFTHGNDIYFNSGKYNPGSSGGQELLAHELTHTVQQTGGVQFKPEESQTDSQAQAETPEIQQKTKGSHFLWRMVQTKMGMLSPKAETGSPDVQAKCSQCESEETIQRQSISPLNSGDSTIQTDVIQDGLGLLGSGIDRGLEAGADGLDWAGDRAQDAGELVGEGLERLADFGVDTIADLVALRSPELADLIRQGPIEALKETVGEGIKDWFDALLEELGISDIVEDFSSSFDTLFETVRLVMEGDPETCDAVANKLNSMTEFVKGVMDNPKVQALQDAFTEANEVFQQILDTFVAPVFNTVMDLVGDALSGIVDFGRQIWEWGAPVRDALKEAWDWVLEQLGIGGGDGESEGGLIDWIKEKAGEAWESIKETLDPVIEPIRTVVMVAAALSPITWIAAAVMYAPQVIDMVRWLWENRNNPNIVESAHEEMGHTILPDLLSGMQGFGDGLASLVDTIIEEVTKISDGFISLVSSLTGLPLLSMIKGTMETISDGIKDFVAWNRNKFQSISKSVVEFAQKIQEKIKPWIEVLTSIGAAIMNPAMIPNILLGWAWRKLPDCYKGPIIDFLLETLIEILQGMPDFPFFGVLWPFLKEGVLGFLRGLLAQSTEVKVAISNKIAKIVSGSSPAFALGFVKGFLRGIWDGLTDPFMLIYEGVTSINDFKDWLNRSEEEGQNQSGQANSTAGQQSTSQSTNQTSQGTQDGRGGRGGAGILQEVGIGILEIVIDRLITMASELEAPSNEVTTNFLSAVQEIFTGAGEDITFEDVMNTMGEVQGQVMNAIGEAGGQIANQVCEFMMQDEAESQIGDAAGWLTGTIVLELVIAYFTVGASVAAKAAIKAARAITKLLDRSGPTMRIAADSMKTLGRHLDEILGSVRKLLNKAGDKASKLMDNLGIIGDILRRYGDEFLEMLLGGTPIPGGHKGPGKGPDAGSSTPGQSTPQGTASGVSSTPGQSTPQGTAGAGSGSPGQASPHNQGQNDSTPGHTPTPGSKPTDRDADSQQNPTPGSHPSPTPGSPHKPGHHGSPSPTPGHPDRPKKKPDEDQDTQTPPSHPKDKDGQKPDDDNTPNSPAYHQRLIRQAIRELEQGEPKDYDTVRSETESEARQVERRYTRRLRRGIKLRVHFKDPNTDEKDGKLNFTVKIAPNDSEGEGFREIQDPLEEAKKDIEKVIARPKTATTEDVENHFEDIKRKWNVDVQWEYLGNRNCAIVLQKSRIVSRIVRIRGKRVTQLILEPKAKSKKFNKLEEEITYKQGTIPTPLGPQTVGKEMKAKQLSPDHAKGEKTNDKSLSLLGQFWLTGPSISKDIRSVQDNRESSLSEDEKLQLENQLELVLSELRALKNEREGQVTPEREQQINNEIRDKMKLWSQIARRLPLREEDVRPIRSDRFYIAGHLLNHNLGGPNDDRNLYPITGDANAEHSREVEEKVKTWSTDKRYWVYYKVTVKQIKLYYNHDKIEKSTAMAVDADFKCEANVLNASGERIRKSSLSLDHTVNSRYEKPRDMAEENQGNTSDEFQENQNSADEEPQEDQDPAVEPSNLRFHEQ